MSRQVGLLRQEQMETFHRVRRTSDLLEKLVSGSLSTLYSSNE
jgi:hypothetical protein